MNKTALSVLGAAVLCVAAGPVVGTARACGGLVSSDGTLGSDAQRAFYAVRDDRTELVVQLFVPQGGKGYGALIPVPVQPTLDPTPVAAADLDALEVATRPRVIDSSVSGGGGFGCGAAAGDRSLGGNGGVIVGDTVAIGPLTAVSLSAQDGAALSTWLNQNGFALPQSAQRVADGYAAPGRWFVALKRNDTPSSRSSIGVHVTLPGDQRGFALRMAGISIATRASFTIFVAAAAGVAPAAPFSGVTLSALDRNVALNDYARAVEQAVQARKGRAFVLEGVYDTTVLPAALAALTRSGSKVTRLSTVLQAADLTEDVAFTAAAPDSVPVVLAAAPRLLSIAGTGTGTASGPLTLATLAALCAFAWSRATPGRRRSGAPAAR